jgi:hypothetical protein
MNRLTIAWILFVGLHTLSAVGECNSPGFHSGQNFINPATGRGAWFVSVKQEDFAVDRIICLVKTMRNQHPEWKEVTISVFTSPAAADHFLPGEADYVDMSVRRRLGQQFHAFYSYTSEPSEEYIDIMPFGYRGPAEYDTRIDLTDLHRPTECRLRVSERCLIAARMPEYPVEALHASGLARFHYLQSFQKAEECIALKSRTRRTRARLISIS